jgi:23S rRNA pseudouridine2605 synthase
MQVRLNKFIADSGITSRRKAEKLILDGRVTVNDEEIVDLGHRVDPKKDVIHVDGEKISPKRHVYYLLNKPRGVVTSTNDEVHRKTVIDLIKTKERIYPVGRLDFNTTGVLLITNDGHFTNIMTHPRNEVPREYEVKLDKPLSEMDKERLMRGVRLDGQRKGYFITVTTPNLNNKRFVEVITDEGRNRFVKRMFQAVRHKVLALHRKTFAGFTTENLQIGEYRKLKKAEIDEALKQYGTIE